MSALGPALLAALALLQPPAPAPGAGAPSMRLENDARRLGKSLWQWTAFLEAPEDVLGRVRCVEYVLHPTFPDPVREVCTRGDGARPFALSAKGWGTFTLRAEVTFTDGTTRELSHRLHFDAP